MKVREDGRVVKVAVVGVTGVHADGYREILGIHNKTSESGATAKSSWPWAKRCCTLYDQP